MTRTTGNPNRNNTTGARRVILTLAVTSTLGFWALFARLNAAPASGAAESNDNNTSLPPSQVDGQVSIQLPPMPTLIPPIDASQMTVAAAPLSNQPSVIVAPASGKIFLGGSKPSTASTTVTRRAPVTRTRSSQ